MAALAPALAEKSLDPVQRIAALLQGFSVEATRPTVADIAALHGLPRGTRIYISAVPGKAAGEIADAAIRLRAAGFEPVPHVAVRNFQSTSALDEFLARLNGEALVQRVLVIGGDRDICGPFRSAIDAIDSGVFRRRGMRAIGIAGYPQGHPKIGDQQLMRTMSDKITAAETTGLAVEVVTQFCFDGRAIVNYVTKLRAFGVEQPIRIGLTGPANIGTLLRYAGRCGVRASTQSLLRGTGLIRGAFARSAPDEIVRTLADAMPAGVSIHFFSFGGLAATARWASSAADGNIVLDRAEGFSVFPPAASAVS
jgi:methylenetetrahydrofolate reductase (NADPH)